jgi:LacI family transcriptional regulator
MPNIRQVAQEAGVSIGTVSRVLNSKPGVGEETRRRVLHVAQELGYNRIRLPSSTVTHLALLNEPTGGTLPTSPFYGDILRGVEQVCHELRISLSYSTLDVANDRLCSLPPLASDDRVGGMILVGVNSQEIVESVVTSLRLPTVLAVNDFPRCDLDAVTIDNRRGAHTATEFLVSYGHRHVALFSGPEVPCVAERREGYHKAIHQHDLAPTVVTARDREIEDGEWAVDELLRRAPETTGIVCSNDLQAIGAIRRLHQIGHKVPDEFSVVGFDDIDMGRATWPSLTTIRVDRKAIGQTAAQLLMGRISTPDRSSVKAIVGVELVERASVCQPRARSVVVEPPG